MPALSRPALPSSFQPRAWNVLLSLVALGLFGCGRPAADPKLLAEFRSVALLADEPDGAETVYEIREDLLGISHADHEHEGEEHTEGESEHAASEHEGHDHEAESGEGHDDHADAEHAQHEEEEHAADHEHEHEHEHAHTVVTESTEKKPVVMLGQVGGLANPWEETQPEYPFSEGQAIFFLADPQAIAEHAEEGHSHAPGEECAFCAAHAEENSDLIAVVRVVGKDGKIIPLDSRDLFDLKLGDLVVVQGKAQVLAGGMLVVEAEGVYVRR